MASSVIRKLWQYAQAPVQMLFPITTLSISRKLSALFLIFFCAPFLAFCYIWYSNSVSTMERSGIYYNEQLVKQVNRQLDEYITGIRNDTQPIPGHPLVQGFIKLRPGDTNEVSDMTKGMANELSPSIMYRRNDMAKLSIVSFNGISFGDQLPDARFADPTFAGDPTEANFKIIGIADGPFPMITVYRMIINMGTYQPAGAVVISFFLTQLERITDLKPFGKNGSISIVNEQGQYMYHPNKAKWGQPLPSDWTQHLTETGNSFIESGPEGQRLVVHHRSPNTGFTIISEMSVKEMMGDLSRLRTRTIVSGTLILALAFVLFYRMFREIRKLLLSLHTAKVREKDLEVAQRDAIVQALQSKINPHFLYNALEIINSYAVVAKVKPISQMTVHLSNLFRYSIGDPDELVSLREELNHTLHYIRIQEERFEDLKYEVRLDEALLDQIFVCRFTLQPILENAFEHAYEKHKINPGKISISGQGGNGYYSLLVTDDGGGMPAELFAKYNEAFETVSEQKLMRTGFSPFPGMGLWNVHSRLMLAFGPPHGLHILHSGKGGTAIEIRMVIRQATGGTTDEISGIASR